MIGFGANDQFPDYSFECNDPFYSNLLWTVEPDWNRSTKINHVNVCVEIKKCWEIIEFSGFTKVKISRIGDNKVDISPKETDEIAYNLNDIKKWYNFEINCRP